MSDIFTLKALSIECQVLDFSIPYSVPHSELFTAIVAREEIEQNPREALDAGIMEMFESVRTQLQQVFLTGGKEVEDMMLEVVEKYLIKYPDERVSEYVDFVRQNRPTLDFFGLEPDLNFNTIGKQIQNKKNKNKTKKQKEKMKKKSRKINRK